MNATLIRILEHSFDRPDGMPRSPGKVTYSGLCRFPSRGIWRNSAAGRRRGISLIEVLMAVFVLTVGLMGIAMVIPAGRALMIEAAKSDRGAACGRAALNDVQIRQWYNSSAWIQKWGDVTGVRSARVAAPPYPGVVAYDLSGLIYGETYFLDPYFVAYAYGTPGANFTKQSVRHFPYSSNSYREFSMGAGITNPRLWPERAIARRVWFDLPEAVVAQLTTWPDELIFTTPTEDGARPRQTFTWTDGQTWPAPSVVGDGATLASTDYRLSPASEGRFTWAMMVTPVVPLVFNDVWDHDNNNATPEVPLVDQGLIRSWDHDGDNGTNTLPVPLVDPLRITQYEVSIVVFYGRNHSCPEDVEIRDATDVEMLRERSAYARLDGGGVGGGDVLLFANGNGSGTTNIPNNPPAGFLNVKKNQWIMLRGLDMSRAIGLPHGPYMLTAPTVCKWYRVLSVDDEQPASIEDPSNPGGPPLTGRGRYVTLEGPDWQVDTDGISGFNSSTDIAEASLVEDVVGVYTITIDVNTP